MKKTQDPIKELRRLKRALNIIAEVTNHETIVSNGKKGKAHKEFCVACLAVQALRGTKQTGHSS